MAEGWRVLYAYVHRQLIVEVIEPYHGRNYDPACGSGRMFVQSARFVENHKKHPSDEISTYGQARVAETIRLCKMNLAVHGLSGDIRQGNTYYEDAHKSVRKLNAEARELEQRIAENIERLLEVPAHG